MSTDAVASSSTRTRDCLSSARHMQTSCRCPTDRFAPRGSIGICSPPLWASDASAHWSSAAHTSASVRSSNGSRLARSVPEKSTGSCGMIESCLRSVLSAIVEISTPSIAMAPPESSTSLKSATRMDDLPAPVLPTSPTFSPARTCSPCAVAHRHALEPDLARRRPVRARSGARERRLLRRQLRVVQQPLDVHHLGLERSVGSDRPVEKVGQRQRVGEREPCDARGDVAAAARLPRVHGERADARDGDVPKALEPYAEPAIRRRRAETGADVVVEPEGRAAISDTSGSCSVRCNELEARAGEREKPPPLSTPLAVDLCRPSKAVRTTWVMHIQAAENTRCNRVAGAGTVLDEGGYVSCSRL
eukprot:3146420-Pleurochrysis_carterae.AAC.1